MFNWVDHFKQLALDANNLGVMDIDPLSLRVPTIKYSISMNQYYVLKFEMFITNKTNDKSNDIR